MGQSGPAAHGRNGEQTLLRGRGLRDQNVSAGPPECGHHAFAGRILWLRFAGFASCSLAGLVAESRRVRVGDSDSGTFFARLPANGRSRLDGFGPPQWSERGRF